MANKPIFFDASGRRSTHVSIVGWTATIVATLIGIAFLVSVVLGPHLASVKIPHRNTPISMTALENNAQSPALLRSAEKLAAKVRAKREALALERAKRNHSSLVKSSRSPILQTPQGRSLSIGFYPNWGDMAFASLQRALPKLDWIVPTWLTLQGPNFSLKTDSNPKLIDYLRKNKPGIAIVPTLQNAAQGKWNGTALAHLLADAKRRTQLVNDVAAFIGENKFQGIVVDFEEVPVSAHKDLKLFLQELSHNFAPHGWVVGMTALFDDDTWPYAEFAKLVDYTFLMAYDEHYMAGEPGSVAGQDWYEIALDKRMKELDPAHTIIVIGSYGYDWHGGPAESVSFQDAMIAAHDANTPVVFDPASDNPHFSYMEDDDTRHDVWFLDGVTAYNQIHAADIYQPAGYAVWRLGSEDPTLWSAMGRSYGASAPADLSRIPIVDDIDFEGSGEILSVEAEPSTGARKLQLDPRTGDINDEIYTQLPTTYVIKQFGAATHKIALTFDDGPDPEWTGPILDILKAKKVPATFFIIGSNAEAHPGLVQRILAEGHEIGSHTFTHPNLADTPEEAVRLELNATQRLFEALTGRSLRLFRPPYLGDAEPSDDVEIVPMKIAQDMGYLTVGEHIDPVDWELPGADVIVQRVLDQANSATAEMPKNIVLLHDAGGDRSQTIEALPLMIDKLREQGYEFVPVSALVPLTREEAMPALPFTLGLLTDRVVFLTLSTLGHVLYWAFMIAIWLGIARLLFLVTMSLWGRRKELRSSPPELPVPPLPVTVIIPAYNEANVIVQTVQGILASDYPDFEVIVVDDGSKDDTVSIMKAHFGAHSRVKIIEIPNGGKANALNVGISKARGEIIVALDADTQFEHHTISKLVRWFGDKSVGAVAGNAKVGNRINMVTRWQALEYISAQNLERRALAALGTLTVVPGAIGAWRRSVLEEMGGFGGDTLAEDQDLTIHMQKSGYKVLFDSTAIAWTEAPATFGGLSKQRFRWSYGTLQCLWKYRSLTFRPRYGVLGMIALPQVWLFQIILTAISPLADLLLIWQLADQWLAYLQHGSEFRNTDIEIVGLYYAIFVIVDFATALFAFLMERREKWSLLWWLLPQRFGYRQLMYYVVVRSIVTAMRGPFVGWGKLERMGTVLVRKPS